MSSLPKGWVTVSLGELGAWRGGGTPSKSDASLWRGGTIPWVSPKDMKRDVISDAEDKLSDQALAHSGTKIVPEGSVLVVVRSGILQHTLPVAVAGRDLAINQDLKALVPHDGVLSGFVVAQIRANAAAILENTVKAGTTVESIDFTRLKAFTLRLAPTAEQFRILKKLEPLLARCASVRAELQEVKQLIARQRRVAFSAAFTRALRQQRKKEPVIGWSTVPLGSLLSDRPSNGISPRAVTDVEGTLSLKLTATTSGNLRLDAEATKHVGFVPPKGSRYWLKSGDLLVQRANSLEHVGAAAIYEGPDETYIYPDLMMRIRINDETLRKYVWRYLNSPEARRYFQRSASGTAGNMPKITGSTLENLEVPIPPRGEMQAILDAVEKLLQRLDGIESENVRCSKLVDKLERSFLARAFAGRLVAQDDRDPPANEILARTRNKTVEEAKLPLRKGRRVEGVQAFVARRIAVWPAEGLTFEQLRSDAPGTYEALKDLVFEMISNNELAQRYDARERKMKLVRPS